MIGRLLEVLHHVIDHLPIEVLVEGEQPIEDVGGQVELEGRGDEERVHVGELQKLLSNLLPDEEEKLDEGAAEVEEEIG